jgi:hypothetical protein
MKPTIQDLPAYRLAIRNLPHNSKAKTPKGIIRAALAHRRDTLRHAPYRPALYIGTKEGLAWQERRALPQEERDTRRAIADPRFRRGLLLSIRAQLRALSALPPRTVEGVMAWEGGTSTRIAAAVSLSARYRRICQGAGISPRTPLPFPSSGLPWAAEVDIGESLAARMGAKLDMRGNDARVLPTLGTSYLHHVPCETQWKNGRPVGYTRAVRDNYVTSFVILHEDGTALARLAGEEIPLTPPEGHRFDIDHNGFRLVRLADGEDYHLNAYDLTVPWDVAVDRLARNAIARQEERARLKAEAADAEGVWVCVADSLRGGNCREGTLQWARNHGLDPRRHYPAPDLIHRMNGDAGRVRLAISAAVHRHRREMEAGVANLADHLIS